MDNLYSKFVAFIAENSLFDPSDKLLIGISGGVDSVVLAHLIDKIGNEYAFAHCNFNLRATESDEDEKFVVNLANNVGVKCFLSSFSTTDYAIEKGISIEMAARELRYEWFENLCEAKGYKWIVVGHHLDDVLETFVLNLSRGTGIRGLSGIKPKTGKVVRPMLFASRAEIEEYAHKNNLISRFDSSNDDIQYKRNLVRHKIIPQLIELNPSFKNNLQHTIQYLNDTEIVFLSKIEEIKQKIVRTEGDWVLISKDKLEELNPISTYLFEILRDYHFNSNVVKQIINALNENPGAQFYSSTHRLVIDRNDLIITALEHKESSIYYIGKTDNFIYEPINLRLTVERYDNEYKIPKVNEIAVLDYDKLQFPLVLRKWQKGEYFCPLGMSGFKKLSDFFVDEKYSIPEKENAWILTSDNKVTWIVGKRIDDRFKLNNDTQLVLRIEILNNENE